MGRHKKHRKHRHHHNHRERWDVEAEVERSGNSFNVLDAEQSASAAAGFLAVAASITGGVDVDLGGILTNAIQADAQNRQQMLNAIRSMRP